MKRMISSYGGYNVPYGLETVKSMFRRSGDSDLWNYSEIEMDFGDGPKLAEYLKSKNKIVNYDERNEVWYIPSECHWTDAYFYPYEYNAS